MTSLYTGHSYDCWWHVKDLRQHRWRKLEDLPGKQATSGKTVSQSFGGTATFAYWDFEGKGVDDWKSISNFTPSRERGGGVQSNLDASAKTKSLTSTVSELSSRSGAIAVDLKIHSPKSIERADCSPVFGVDFSGGKEDSRGNKKIWIASWDRQAERIDISQGSQLNIRRKNLPEIVLKKKGFWVFDFPFGISGSLAKAAGYKDWKDWVNYCGSQSNEDNYMTKVRDKMRQVASEKGVTWSTRRSIDNELGTTWFPLFEQLYRQTISGAAEVIFPLMNHFEDVCILPWNSIGNGKSIVSEGFPGVVLTHRLGMPATGYKGTKQSCRLAREAIVGELVASHGLPLSEAQQEVVTADPEGDALDAILLLLSAANLEETCRNNAFPTSGNDETLLEGWFLP